jgi:hypothetical protein
MGFTIKVNVDNKTRFSLRIQIESLKGYVYLIAAIYNVHPLRNIEIFERTVPCSIYRMFRHCTVTVLRTVVPDWTLLRADSLCSIL